MPTLIGQSQDQRKADTLLKESKEKLSGVSIVLNKQIKVWQAMFVTLFIAGFVAAIAFVVGFTGSEKNLRSSGIEFSGTEAAQGFLKPGVPPRVKVTIRRITPKSGPIDTAVVLTGTGFARTGNTVHFGSGVIQDLPAQVRGQEGILTFIVPKYLVSGCDAPPCDSAPPLPLMPGNYRVWVSNANGKSNETSFTVIAPRKEPVIGSINPSTGQTGTALTIFGSGFLQDKNYVRFASSDGRQDGYEQVSSPDGRTISFVLPRELDSMACLTDICPEIVLQPIPLLPGTYTLSVLNQEGESNTVMFKVTDAL